jgi:hypothetical protein
MMAYKWGVHIDLFRCAQNVLEIPHGLRILMSVLRHRKEHVKKSFGRNARLFTGQANSW